MKNEFRRAFGRAVQQARHARGLTTAELGELVGASHHRVKDIELGRRPVAFEDALAIMSLLKIRLADFCSDIAA